MQKGKNDSQAITLGQTNEVPLKIAVANIDPKLHLGIRKGGSPKGDQINQFNDLNQGQAQNNSKSLASQRFAIFSAYQKQQIQLGHGQMDRAGHSGISSHAESTVNIPHNLTTDDRGRKGEDGFLSPVNEVSVNNKQTPNTIIKHQDSTHRGKIIIQDYNPGELNTHRTRDANNDGNELDSMLGLQKANTKIEQSIESEVKLVENTRDQNEYLAGKSVDTEQIQGPQVLQTNEQY